MKDDKNVKVRIPSTVNFDKLFDGVKGNKTKIQFLKDGMIYILSLLVVDNYTLVRKNGYRRLNNQILSDIIGNTRPEQIFKILMEKGVVEVKSYSKGRYSKSYRLSETYNTGHFKSVDLSDRIKNKLQNWRDKKKTEERDLNKELFFILEQFDKNEIGFDNQGIERFIVKLGTELFQKTIKMNQFQRGFTLKSVFNYIGKTKYLIQDINKKEFRKGFSQSNHRFNSSITSLPKNLRPFLRINGCRVGEIDISSSQPYILSTILNPHFSSNETEGYNLRTIFGELKTSLDILKPVIPSHKPGNDIYELGVWMTEMESRGLKRFTQLDFKNDFYQHILDEGYRQFPMFMKSRKGFSKGRDYIKKYIMYFLFESDDEVRWDTNVVELLSKIYPDLCNYIERFIQTHGSRDFSLLLQRTESYLVLRNVCKIIHDNHSHIPFYTIHDCIITTDSNLDIVREIMTSTVLRITGKPVRVKSFNYVQSNDIDPLSFEEEWDDLKIPSVKKYEKMKSYLLDKNITNGLNILPPKEQVYWKEVMNKEIDFVLKR